MNQLQTRDSSSVRTVALICDPEAAPAEIAGHLCQVLPAQLAESSSGSTTFEVRLHRERLPIGAQGDQQSLIERAGRLKRQRGWDAAVCVTDLPLCGEHDEPLVADLSIELSVAVLSLPAFGAPRLRRRVTDVTVEILHDLIPALRRQPPTDWPDLSATDRNLRGPFRLVTPDSSGIDAQVVATRGRWRQLLGMVRANRPWRLWLGVRRGVVAALAFSVLLLINPTVWELGIDQSMYRLGAISLCVIAAMVAWLIFYHHLWMFADEPADRKQVLLFNASTVVTFVLGLSVAFVSLLALNVVASHLLLTENVLARQLGSPPGVVEYFKLSWMATAGASMVGALGTGFENEEDVREAAYSPREAERGRHWRRETERGVESAFGETHREN